MNNFFKQAEMAERVMEGVHHRIMEQHKDCPNFIVFHDVYSCTPGCRVSSNLTINEIEKFVDKFNRRKS